VRGKKSNPRKKGVTQPEFDDSDEEDDQRRRKQVAKRPKPALYRDAIRLDNLKASSAADIVGYSIASLAKEAEENLKLMLSASVRAEASYLYKYIGWWVNQEFYAGIAVEGALKWFQWGDTYVPDERKVRKDIIQRACAAFLQQALSALNIARSIHPRLSSSSIHTSYLQGVGGSQGEQREAGTEEADEFSSDLNVADSIGGGGKRYGIGPVNERTADRYAKVLEKTFIFLIHVSQQHGDRDGITAANAQHNCHIDGRSTLRACYTNADCT
jgi:hypothetical protein